MNKVLYDRLVDTLRQNYRQTQLYAALLNGHEDAITPEMINAICEDGNTTRTEAVVALLSEMFSLDFNDASDRTFIRRYLTPSVREMDARKYTENPYYKTIKIDDVKDGAWELRRECYPAYRLFIAGDMEISDDMCEIAPLGFFSEDFYFPAVLEDGNEWMTLTPVDLDTSDEAIEAAHGKVVTFGLGLGYYAFMCAEKEEVESITVIEKSPDVIRLFKTHILPKFPNADKVRIICADAFLYAEEEMPKEGYDVAFVDTWRDASDGAPMYARMKKLEHLSCGTRFLYWIEGFLKSRLRAERYEALARLGLVDSHIMSYEELVKYLTV